MDTDNINPNTSQPQLELPPDQPAPHRSAKLPILTVLLVILIVGSITYLVYSRTRNVFPPGVVPPTSTPAVTTQSFEFEKFSSEQEFKNYLKNNESSSGMYNRTILPNSSSMEDRIETNGNLDVQKSVPPIADGGSDPSRVSETNVQVLGIDEPDILKTDGKNIFYSPENLNYIDPFPMLDQEAEIDLMYPKRPIPSQPQIKIVKAFPPQESKVISQITNTGDLFLYRNTLIVLGTNIIQAYDVSDPSNPQEKWKLNIIENTTQLAESRLYGNKLYIVTRTSINSISPCPFTPMTKQVGSAKKTYVEIRCTHIYRPSFDFPASATFTAMTIDPESGDINNSLSFIGSYDSSVIYMSRNSLYVTYSYNEDLLKVFSDFFDTYGKDLLPQASLDRLKKLSEYDISTQSKFIELTRILEEYKQSLDKDEKLKLENEMENRMDKYMKEKKRDLEKTAIVKIKLDNFSLENTGSIPGRPLNQFALDEYKDHLRVATTVGGNLFGSRETSANDIYVLNTKLQVTGSVIDLGLTERVYSARFIGDQAYVVTFRQVDPFYVLDLSNPSKPQLKGQLKIPGYSSYLHPIDENYILGIGKENANVKVSLFDVHSPENPTEADKYILKDYNSDILQTSHAFLLDKNHSIFFLPGDKGGYVFSYRGNKLQLVKAVADIQATRALYIDDYLYIVGDDKIVILNENTWQQVNEVTL